MSIKVAEEKESSRKGAVRRCDSELKGLRNIFLKNFRGTNPFLTLGMVLLAASDSLLLPQLP